MSDNKATGTASAQIAVPHTSAAAPQYKYDVEIRQIVGCPFHATACFTEASYRAVQSDIRHPSNFLPAGRLEPEKYANSALGHKCMSWALSLYESPDQLRAMIRRAEQVAPLFRLRVGDHYARLQLTATDGKRTAVSRSGHFSFYEFASFDPHGAVKEHLPLF